MPATKLPWRTIITTQGDWGRFKRDELRRAVLEVKELHEARDARRKRRPRVPARRSGR